MSRLASQRRFTLGIAAPAVVVAVWASTAWACSPTAHLEVSPGSAAPGSTIRIEGREFHSGQVGVYLTTQAGQDVSRLWAGRGPTIHAVNVTVPSAPPGLYLVVGRSEGTAFASPPAAFEVTAPPATTGSASPPPAVEPPPGDPAPSPTSQQPPPAAASTVDAAPQPVPARSGQAAAGAGAAPAPPQATPAAPAVRAAASQTAAPVPSTAAAVAHRATTATTAASPAPPGAAAAPAPPHASALSPRSATDDASSGFSEGSPRGPRAHSLTDPVAADNPAGLALGVVLLSLGLVALTVVSGGAAVRRQRALARQG